ncbi:MAG TPA: metallophosphoesterase [Burkholderiaceae bacterium]|nr:metallophosphoesterase [Burkholderiaceae bacterium]
MIKLLHVSDPHFGTERPVVVEALVHLARREAPELLILSGDITQRARAHQFAAARRFVERLGVAHVLAVPGNHDIPLFNIFARLFAPYRGYQRCFGPDLEPEYESPEVLVLGVNTTRWWRHKHGEVSRQQIERVAQRLHAAAPSQLRVVVTHQPVHVIRDRDVKNLLRGHARALSTWSKAGAQLVLGGHIHLAHVRPVEGLWSVLAGTAVSRRVRHGRANSVNLIRYADGACTVERWDHDAAAGFVCAKRTAVIAATASTSPISA